MQRLHRAFSRGSNGTSTRFARRQQLERPEREWLAIYAISKRPTDTSITTDTISVEITAIETDERCPVYARMDRRRSLLCSQPVPTGDGTTG